MGVFNTRYDPYVLADEDETGLGDKLRTHFIFMRSPIPATDP